MIGDEKGAVLTDEQINGWWDVTRVGEWNGSIAGKTAAKIAITQDTIQEMAADYNRELHYAPVTVDHVQNGAAMGWVEALRVVGDRLQAKMSFNGWFRYSLQDRSFLNRSIEFADKFAATSRSYLTAVTFLGAAKPAAKGLSPIPAMLAEDGHAFTVSDNSMQLGEPVEETGSKRDALALAGAGDEVNNEKKEESMADLKEHEEKISQLSEQVKTGEKALADTEKALAESRAENAELKAKIEQGQKDAALSEIRGKLDALVEKGEMVPVERDAELSMAEALPADKITGWFEGRAKVYAARGLSLFKEQTKGASGDSAGDAALSVPEEATDKEAYLAAMTLSKKEGISFYEAAKRVDKERAGK